MRLLLALTLLTSLPVRAADDPVIAVVNGRPIPASALIDAAERKQPAVGDTLSDAERDALVQKLVADELLYQRALALGYDRSPKVRRVMVNALVEDRVFNKVRNSDFTDQELNDYFEAHQADFVVQEKAQIRYLRVAAGETRSDEQALALASGLREELLADLDRFSELARLHSDDAYSRRGGDLGFVSREGKAGLDPRVVEAAWGLAPGALSEVFPVEGGYGLALVTSRRERIERSFEQMKSSVLRTLKNQRYNALYAAYVADLQEAARVRVNQRAVEAVPMPAQRGPGARGAALEQPEEGPEEGPEQGPDGWPDTGADPLDSGP